MIPELLRSLPTMLIPRFRCPATNPAWQSAGRGWMPIDGRRRQGYVWADGASDDPAEVAAYGNAPAGQTARWHDARAAELTARSADPLLVEQRCAWHLEHGSDPTGAGRRALRALLDHCVDKGYSSGTIDIGERGRLLSDPDTSPEDFYHFTAKLASALVPHGEHQRCEQLYRELQRTSANPRTHRTAAYALAMLHTRFLDLATTIGHSN